MWSQPPPFNNDTGRPQQRFEFRLKVPRSSIVSLQVRDSAEREVNCEVALPGEGQVWFDLREPIDPGTSISITLEWEGSDPPQLKNPKWEVPSPAQAAEVVFLSLNQVDWQNLLRGVTPTRVREAAARFIQEEGDPEIQRFKSFFFDLDALTNPDLGFLLPSEEDYQARRSAFDKAGQAMELLLSIRLQRLAVGHKAGKDDLSTVALPKTARKVSDLLLPLYRKYFGDDSSSLNQAAIATAFSRFANGELRTGDSLDECPWNCEPDSAYEFFFAEHALWTIYSGADVEEWTKILPCLAVAQQFFVAAYHPDGPGPYLRTRYAPWNYKKLPKLDPQRITRAFDSFRNLDLQQISERMDENWIELLRG